MRVTFTNCGFSDIGTVMETDDPSLELVASGTTFERVGKVLDARGVSAPRGGLRRFAGDLASGLTATAIGKCMGL